MAKETKQGTLPIKPGDKYTQQKIDGSGTLKETTPKEIQTAADRFFLRKADFACAKSNVEKAASEMLASMGKHKMTQVKVYDQDRVPKRIIIRSGEEKLKVENAND